MSDYKELSLGGCIARLLKINNPLVLMHVRPDADTVGSARGLIELFSLLGIKAKYASSDRVPKRLEFLLEGAERAEEWEYRSLCPVSIDVSSPSQLGPIMEKLPKVELMIDHHEAATPYADIYTVRGASSAGEVLFGIVEELISRGIIEKITPELAYPIYAAISSDTGGFRYSNTAASTHLAAARLIECGIDSADINHRLFTAKSREQLLAEGLVSSRLLSAMDGKISYSYISKQERDERGLEFECFDTAIDIVRSVAGAELAFIIKETEDGDFRASIRSVGADVTICAKRFGGGGHIRAAGCSIPAGSAKEAAELLRAALVEIYF